VERRLRELRDAFAERFGGRAQAGARAPGRVNLIGEHTDYNEGLVLPCAIDRDTLALVRVRGGSSVRVFSRERAELRGFDVGAPARAGAWVDYVQGVVVALRERGAEVPGFDLALASSLPAGAGLSSSAALTVAVATALDAALGLELDAPTRARVAHRAESAFVGVPCGIMDPFASALGRRGCALRIDCRDQTVRTVALPAGLRLLVAHSGQARALAAGGYAERRAECERALAQARRAGIAPRARALRDLGPDALPALERALDAVAFRRARHVISENARVDACCEALSAGDAARAGQLLRAGMRSLRDDFAVSTPELDALCEIADGLPGVRGSRLTGAGFGGCTLHLVSADASEAAAAALAAAFEHRFARRPPVWTCTPADGASALAPTELA
jgi:galactokinase